jgi:hypothetical protein
MKTNRFARAVLALHLVGALTFSLFAPVVPVANAANNGTIKMDGVAFDAHPDNEPHLPCKFEVDAYNYAADIESLHVLIDTQPLTTIKGSSSLTNPVFRGVIDLDQDPATGADELGLDGSLEIDLTSILPELKNNDGSTDSYKFKITVGQEFKKDSTTELAANSSKFKVFWVDDCVQTPQPPTVLPCVDTTAVHSTSLSAWSLSETRSGGHNDLVENGLHVWTDSNTSLDKAAGYYPTNFSLQQAGVPSIEFEAFTGTRPGLQLVVDKDNNGSIDGILVYEPWAYTEGYYWSNANFGINSGAGYTSYGTLNEYLTANPNAKVLAIGYSLGSGVKGDAVITKITAGCVVYTFDLPEQTGSIKGYKWNDANEDKKSTGEQKLSGWTIFIDDNNNQILDNGEPSDVTDVDGNYEFANLPLDVEYTICEVMQSGWVQTFPGTRTGCKSTTLTKADPIKSGKDFSFGNKQITQAEVDACDPSTYSGSVADMISKTKTKCVDIDVVNVCGLFQATIKNNKTPYLYKVSYSIDALNYNFNTDASNVVFTEDQSNGKATVYYWAVGPEKDFFTALNMPWYNISNATAEVDTNCATDTTPKTPDQPTTPTPTPVVTPTPGQVLGESVAREQGNVLAAVTELPSTGVNGGGISLFMSLFLGALMTRRRLS